MNLIQTSIPQSSPVGIPSKTHRVLLTSNVLTTQKYGGISRYIVQLALGIAACEQWDVKIGSPLYQNAYLHQARDRLGHRGVRVARFRRGMLQLNDLLVRILDCGWLASADIVHETHYNPDPLRRSRSGRVSTFYDMMSEALAPDPGVFKKKKLTAERSDKIFAISEATKADVVYYLGIAPEKIEVIHLASSIIPETQRSGLVPDKPYLLWVGARYAYKNFSGLVRSLAKSRAFQSDLNLVCAGAGDFSKEELELAASQGIDPSKWIHCQPNENELASLYAHAEMLVYPSTFEGFGLPPLEAMTCRCPVVAANATSIPEVTGDAALLVDPHDAEAIAAAIDQVYGSAAKRRELVEAGVRRAAEFSWQRCVASHLRAYQSLIS